MRLKIISFCTVDGRRRVGIFFSVREPTVNSVTTRFLWRAESPFASRHIRVDVISALSRPGKISIGRLLCLVGSNVLPAHPPLTSWNFSFVARSLKGTLTATTYLSLGGVHL